MFLTLPVMVNLSQLQKEPSKMQKNKSKNLSKLKE